MYYRGKLVVLDKMQLNTNYNFFKFNENNPIDLIEHNNLYKTNSK